MLKKVQETINSYQMLEPNETIIVGVSGGPDSMVLLDILIKIVKKNGNKLIAAHLNHKFRGEDADNDAEFVRSECSKRGIHPEIKEYDVKHYMKESGLGAQEAAREVRYQFYLETAKKHQAKKIALGHHLNDQAETIVMRLLRGTAVHGLTGIPYTRVFQKTTIIRPLLDIRRAEIEDYCTRNNIAYRTDKSNFSEKYFRNNVRLNVIPYLQQYSPQISTNLHQLAKVTQDEDRFIEEIALRSLEELLIKKDSKSHFLNIDKLQTYNIALQRRMIHLILRCLYLKDDPSYKHVEVVLDLTRKNHPAKSLDLSGVKVYRNYNELIFSTDLQRKNQPPFQHELGIPSKITISEIGKVLEVYVSNILCKPAGVWAVFDLDSLDNQRLHVRSRNEGDRIAVKGMIGSKKVKDIFIDEKIPQEERNSIPIVVDGDNNILWIAGIKRSKHALVSEKTKKFLNIVFHDSGEKEDKDWSNQHNLQEEKSNGS